MKRRSKADDRYSRPIKIYSAVQVRYGRTVEKGFLPVFSVDTEAQAKSLIVATCSLDNGGNYYSRELAAGQTLENLQMFSDKLARVWKMIGGKK